jgi:uncharacterized protein
MILVDTGFLLALLDPRDALHDRARAWAVHIRDQLLVTEYVLLETVNFASAPANRVKVHALVEHVRSNAGYEILAASPTLFDAGLRLHASRPDKQWSLTDCISFVVMERRQLKKALAYDHHFEQAGFEALLRRDPE